MKISDYPFTTTDVEYTRIKNFLIEVAEYPQCDNNWSPGRMDWWRYNVHAKKGDDFFTTHAHYWKTDEDKVVGLFISEYGGNDFFAIAHPDIPDLFLDVLQWGIKVWASGKQKITTSIFTVDQRKVEQLIDTGFYEDGHESNIRTYDLTNYDCSYTLKPGFEILTFQDYGNYESRVNLVRNAFNNPAFTEERLRSLQSSPEYNADLDLVIVNTQGESVAYCMAWQEENDPSAGYIEPMGTHSDYRQQGFGSILAKECFKRLRDLGVTVATIASDAEPDVSNFLYDSLKPVSIKRAYNYSLNL